MTVVKTVSTNGSFIIISGTYAEVSQSLENEVVPASQICGMSHQGTTGSCAVLIKRH